MSTKDTVQPIEDEPYYGLYRGQTPGFAAAEPGVLPGRFELAEILKSAREKADLSLDEVSEITRVRRNYLEALEQAAYDVLPPRAFTIGYVKAYARALGLDEETLADMYRRDAGATPAKLHAPSGASLEDVKPNYRLYVTAALCLVAAVVVWNVVQHRPTLHYGRNEDPFASQKWVMGVPLIRDGVVLLTKPAPAPRDQDIPPAYVTPGLEDGFASIAAADNSDAAAPVPVADVLQMRKAFNPQGAVYGASPEQSSVTIQATKSVNLVVHGPDNVIYFARELGQGEAYRLPQAGQDAMVLDVTDPASFEVYYNGEYAGMMDNPKTPIGVLNAKAASWSAALDQKQAQAGQVVGATLKTPPRIEAPKAEPRPDAPIPYLPSVRSASASAEAPSVSAAPAAGQP